MLQWCHTKQEGVLFRITTQPKGMTGSQIKLLALIFMVLDHIHCFFEFTGKIPLAFTMLGRLSAPLFLFCTVEGFAHIHSRKRYFMRIYAISAVMGLVEFFGLYGGIANRADGFFPVNAIILAVDDDRDLCDLLQAALARDGHTVRTLCSGDAVTEAHCRWADCILLDVMMPGEDGFAICRPAGGHWGLGLYLARAVAWDHGGSLALQNTPAGAATALTIAAALPGDAARRPGSPAPRRRPGRGRHPRPANMNKLRNYKKITKPY